MQQVLKQANEYHSAERTPTNQTEFRALIGTELRPLAQSVQALYSAFFASQSTGGGGGGGTAGAGGGNPNAPRRNAAIVGMSAEQKKTPPKDGVETMLWQNEQPIFWCGGQGKCNSWNTSHVTAQHVPRKTLKAQRQKQRAQKRQKTGGNPTSTQATTQQGLQPSANVGTIDRSQLDRHFSFLTAFESKYTKKDALSEDDKKKASPGH